MPVDLLENELFGHESGAYTSASGSAVGLVEQADRGTLFLDELDSLPATAQVKLLRFLQDKEYRPLGSRKARTADVRIIAATNCDLKSEVEAGRFRRDLFYRLAVVQLRLPPLRERPGDVPLLARRFLTQYAAELKKAVTGFSSDALLKLDAYTWPGNIRELQNVVARSVLFAAGPVVQSADICLPLPAAACAWAGTFQSLKAETIRMFEMQYLTRVLDTSRGNISKAARMAGKNRRAFWQLLRKHGLAVERKHGDLESLAFPSNRHARVG